MSKIIIQTTYENVDIEWLKFWLSECSKIYGIPDDENLINELPFVHSIRSKDPTSEVVGTTVIEITK